MADIELVIKIPEYEYKNILLTGKASFRIVNAIEAGTPLPKGHGRLIDVDVIEPDCCGEWNGLYESLDRIIKYTEREYKEWGGYHTVIQSDIIKLRRELNEINHKFEWNYGRE